jgi:hypothetical protein
MSDIYRGGPKVYPKEHAEIVHFQPKAQQPQQQTTAAVAADEAGPASSNGAASKMAEEKF